MILTVSMNNLQTQVRIIQIYEPTENVAVDDKEALYEDLQRNMFTL